jgi:hypothetical protein
MLPIDPPVYEYLLKGVKEGREKKAEKKRMGVLQYTPICINIKP